MGRPKGSKNRSAAKAEKSCCVVEQAVASVKATSCNTTCEVNSPLESFTKSLNLIHDLVFKLSKYEELVAGHNNLGAVCMKAFEHINQMEQRLAAVENFIKGTMAARSIVPPSPSIKDAPSLETAKAPVNNGTSPSDALDGI